MRLVDSSAWIEWLLASPTGHAVKSSIPERAQWLVPTIIQLEVAKWAYRTLEVSKADEVIAFTEKCVVVPLDTPLALAAAELCRQHKLATADAIVYATARAHGADLLTCDAHFDGLPGVTFIAKRP
jgi:predicted nucleic acid-binding protein